MKPVDQDNKNYYSIILEKTKGGFDLSCLMIGDNYKTTHNGIIFINQQIMSNKDTFSYL